jgi:ACR3 family arsenite efflux pump ArsB
MEDQNKQAINDRKRRTKRLLYFLLPIEFVIVSATFFGVALWLDLPWQGILIGYILAILAISIGSVLGWKIVKQTFFDTDYNEKSE